MLQKRMTSDSRRRQILDVAKGCFSRHGFAGTTTKSLAAAAGISEGLLFKHFPTKAALYAEILAESCEADPDLIRLMELEPSTATLVQFVREMVRHFLDDCAASDHEEGQKLRLMVSSHLGDGEFVRLVYEKVGKILGPVFAISLERAVAVGDATRVSTTPLNLFWFAHNLLHTVALTRLPAVPSLPYPADPYLERQLCDFILRGLGLSDAAIRANLDRVLSDSQMTELVTESA
ncbi:MAG: TetR/AcrR family transcriptional regulator [Bradyrhizobiaceae bacterium]|nr:MAG: TetR/AcrR family transcriptional regulator [Bradyrhizobiaceae bacterium]